VESPNTEGFRAMLARLFPGREDSLQERFAESGVHLRLGVRDEGSCVFLGESGCVLPEEAKPVHCRLFPVWMRGRTVAIVDAECDLVARSRGTAALLAAIGLDRQELRRLFAAMRKGLDLGPGNGI
jgi:Fe-S-cluster containining protein